MAYVTQPRVVSSGAPAVRTVSAHTAPAPVMTLPPTYAMPVTSLPSVRSVVAPAVGRQSVTYTTASYHTTPRVVTAAPVTYRVQTAAPAAMTATVKAKQATPHLDAAVHDENTFIQFVINATSGTHTEEYKELYHFLLDVFLEADTDFDGLVGSDRFDYMIERAAMLPRKFGLAPSEAETYPTTEARRAAREAEFRAIDTSGDGLIAFDEWLAWSMSHISGKAEELKSGRVAACNWNLDKEHFVSWITSACTNKSTREYKELYHFLLECFTAADDDHDGKVSHAEFDMMIEVAAEAPRRFGFAPPASQTYATDADRVAARQKEFAEMDIHNHGFISFDDWLRWSYNHICGKVATLR